MQEASRPAVWPGLRWWLAEWPPERWWPAAVNRPALSRLAVRRPVLSKAWSLPQEGMSKAELPAGWAQLPGVALPSAPALNPRCPARVPQLRVQSYTTAQWP